MLTAQRLRVDGRLWEGGLGEGQGSGEHNSWACRLTSSSRAVAARRTKRCDASHAGTLPPPQDGGQGGRALVREWIEKSKDQRANILAGAESLGLIVAE